MRLCIVLLLSACSRLKLSSGSSSGAGSRERFLEVEEVDGVRLGVRRDPLEVEEPDCCLCSVADIVSAVSIRIFGFESTA